MFDLQGAEKLVLVDAAGDRGSWDAAAAIDESDLVLAGNFATEANVVEGRTARLGLDGTAPWTTELPSQRYEYEGVAAHPTLGVALAGFIERDGLNGDIHVELRTATGTRLWGSSDGSGEPGTTGRARAVAFGADSLVAVGQVSITEWDRRAWIRRYVFE
jgi:hypothetical protein